MKKIYRRFFLSFLIVLVLPIIFFSTFFLKNYREIYRDKLIEKETIFAEKTLMELERNVEVMHSIVSYNTQLPYMQKYFVLHDIWGTEITTTLSSEVVTHSFLVDIHYYNPIRPERVYVKVGTYGMNYYAKYIGIDSALSAEEYLEKQKIGAVFQKMTDGTLSEEASLRYVIKNTSGDMWIFFISKEYLEEILKYDDANTILLDSDNTVLQEIASDNYQDGTYYNITVCSEENNLKLVRQISEDVLFHDLKIWQNRFLVLVFCLLVFGGVLIAVLTFYNEYPVKKMKFWYEEQFSLSEEKHKRNILLMRLIMGSGCGTEQFRNSVAEAGLFKDTDYYRVIIAMSTGEHEIELNRLKLYVSEGIHGEVHLIDIPSHKMAVMLVGLTINSDHVLKQNLESVCEELKRNTGREFVFYVGDRQETYENIHLSYHMAVMGSRSDTVGEQKNVVFCNVEKQEQSVFLYPEIELNYLYNALIEADMDKADVITNALIQILEEQSDNRIIRASLYYDIRNVYYRAQMKLEWNIKSVILDIDSLNKADNVDEISVIKHLKNQFKIYVEGNEGHAKEEKLITRVIKFIDENHTCSDLCVSMVADHFGVSISNLSHQFKAQTSCTISDYIREKKFEYAGELLRDTDYSVQMVGTIIGYNQTANFIQKFKRYYGITPAEYRKQQCESGKTL